MLMVLQGEAIKLDFTKLNKNKKNKMPKSKANQIIELTPKNKSPEKSKEDKTDSSSEDFISKHSDLLTRIGVYSLNIGSRYLSEAYKAKESVENLVKDSIEIGNFYGALGFATLDVLAGKNSKFKRLSKFGGYLFYIGSCGYDLISGLNDWDNLWPNLGNFALDVTMAYQLGKDTGSLYKELDGESQKETKFGISKDLEGIVSFFTGSDKENKSSGEGGKTEPDSKSKLKDYLSALGKGIGYGFSSGTIAGFSFGKSAFEKLSENYSVYKTEQKESNKLKKVKDEEIKKQRAEQKIKNAGFEETSLKKKKEILFYLDEKGKNPNFMKNYEIENAYGDFKQKPVKEQIQIITDKRNYFENGLKQMKSVSWGKRFWNSSEISYTKSALKKLDKILFELEVEEKNYPYQSQNIKNFIKKKEDEDNKNRFEI